VDHVSRQQHPRCRLSPCQAIRSISGSGCLLPAEQPVTDDDDRRSSFLFFCTSMLFTDPSSTPPTLLTDRSRRTSAEQRQHQGSEYSKPRAAAAGVDGGREMGQGQGKAGEAGAEGAEGELETSKAVIQDVDDVDGALLPFSFWFALLID
jgi:hypothetical protein